LTSARRCDPNLTVSEAGVTRLALIMAMQVEAVPVIAALGATTVPPPTHLGPLPGRLYQSNRDGVDVTVAVNGIDSRHGVANIGTQPAALATWATALHIQPDLIVSIGAAGGWAGRGAAVGDLVVSDGPVVYHDRRIAMPRFDDYGVGFYPSLPANRLAAALDAKLGTVTTSNSLDETDDDRRMIAANGGDAKEMEAAAVAWVAEMFGIPFVAIKAITDLVDSPTATADQFDANLDIAAARLARAAQDLISFASATPLTDFGS